ncbi:MAG: hypothetical protein A2Y60_01175 [Chloroflexi bacterium RBG_13_54_9]|nr:MAG: hypothetical protein A2Y60_01175 [Chloroflexi bacterium RBG_13_54_9]
MERVLIIGPGPQARSIPDAIAAAGTQELLGFVDVANERRFLRGDGTHFPIYEAAQFPEELKEKLGEFSVLITIDRKGIRQQLIEQVRQAGLPLANIIHPSAVISPSARLGGGILIAPGVIIGPGASIGNHVIINSAATIDHDSIVQDDVIISPGVHLAGFVTVKNGTFIGIGACSVPGVTIGANCTIGAGAVVIGDIPDNVVAAGVPAKVIRTQS